MVGWLVGRGGVGRGAGCAATVGTDAKTPPRRRSFPVQFPDDSDRFYQSPRAFFEECKKGAKTRYIAKTRKNASKKASREKKRSALRSFFPSKNALEFATLLLVLSEGHKILPLFFVRASHKLNLVGGEIVHKRSLSFKRPSTR